MTSNVRYFKQKSIWRQTIPSWCDTVPSIFFSAPYDPTLLFSSWLPFRHTEEALLPVPQVDSGSAGHLYERDGGCKSRSCWWDTFHLEQYFALNDRLTSPGKQRQLTQTPGSGADEKHRDYLHFHSIFHISPNSILFQVVLDQHFQDCDILN